MGPTLGATGDGTDQYRVSGKRQITCILPTSRPKWTYLRSPKRWGVGMTDVTRILNAIERGDAGATDDLLPLV